eukprot:3486490-Rhodomonas_salina.1
MEKENWKTARMMLKTTTAHKPGSRSDAVSAGHEKSIAAAGGGCYFRCNGHRSRGPQRYCESRRSGGCRGPNRCRRWPGRSQRLRTQALPQHRATESRYRGTW